MSLSKIYELTKEVEKSGYQIICQSAINIVELKIQMIALELSKEYNRLLISSITSRIKSPESIYRKLQRKGYEIAFENAQELFNDLIGVRVTCFFEDDIYELVKRISSHEDVKVIKYKDYIKKPKSSGYHSFHLIIEVPVYSDRGCEWKKVEIQFRTVAMDFWAQLDYQLCYKREMLDCKAENVQKELSHYAELIAKVDRNMMRLRKEIETM